MQEAAWAAYRVNGVRVDGVDDLGVAQCYQVPHEQLQLGQRQVRRAAHLLHTKAEDRRVKKM